MVRLSGGSVAIEIYRRHNATNICNLASAGAAGERKGAVAQVYP